MRFMIFVAALCCFSFGCSSSARLAPAPIAVRPLVHYAPMQPDPPPLAKPKLPAGLIVPDGWYAEVSDEQSVVFLNIADPNAWFELRTMDGDFIRSLSILGVPAIETVEDESVATATH